MTDANADKQTDDTGMSGEDSAPQDKKDQDAGQEGDSPVSEKASSGMVRDISKLREDRRQLREKTSSLESELSEIKGMLAEKKKDTSTSEGGENVDAATIEKHLANLLEQREREARLSSEKAKANEVFGKLRWVNEDEKFGDEVHDLIHTKYESMFNQYPTEAVRLAYKDVCSEHQVPEDYVDNSASKASGGPGSSAPAGAGPKVDAQSLKALRESTDMSNPEQRALYKKKVEALRNSGQ